MSRKARLQNRHFFFFVLAVSLIGFFLFSSASLGLLNREGANYGQVVLTQFVILLISLVLMILLGKYDYRHLRSFALPIFITALAVNVLILISSLGFESGGGRRWLLLGGLSFQPSEFLKLASVVYLASWFTREHSRLDNWRDGLLPFLGFAAIISIILFLQSDFGTMFVLLGASMMMFFAAGARWKHLVIIILLAVLSFGALILFKPHAKERIATFLNPTQNLQSTGYQVNQSLITIGSGGFWGRGFGRSVQKFHYLPEPIGDSIFAVISEEFGFLGALMVVGIFLTFAFWGIRIANRAPDKLGSLLVVGVVSLITISAFVNISSMLGLVPLTGLPLVFFSKGGSSLMFALFGCGIILSVIRQSRNSRS